MTEKTIKDGTWDDTLQGLKQRIKEKLKEKGKGAFHSEWEVLGKLLEEFNEFEKAVHDREGQDFKVDELYDVAIVALWGIASYKEGMKEKVKKKV